MSAGPSNKNNETESTGNAAKQVAQKSLDGIFKLNVDCCEKIFEWLSIEDLHSMGQTCKRMKQIAGKFFRAEYPSAKITSNRDGIYYTRLDGSTSSYRHSPLDGFIEFIEMVDFDPNCFNCNEEIKIQLENALRNIEEKCKSLKKFSLGQKSFNIKTDLISKILKKIESIDGIGDENILDSCPNLKYFSYNWFRTPIDWFFNFHKCKNLEYISLTQIEDRIEGFERFFDQIRKIKTIEIDGKFLLANSDAFCGTNAQLDNFKIDFTGCKKDKTSLCSILNTLHARLFYKRLHFTGTKVDQQWFNAMASLHALKTIEIGPIEDDVIWPEMQDLEEISIEDADDNKFDFTTLPYKLPNLRQIHSNTIKSILPFIRCSNKLSRILLEEEEEEETFLTKNVLNLPALNKERTKLVGAYKVIIYVSEKIFLATKYAMGECRSLIEIKRIESMKSNK